MDLTDQTTCSSRRARGQTSKLIAIIDDDECMQDSLRDLIESGGFEAKCFGSAKAFLESELHRRAACLIVDIRMPKMSGLELQARLKQEECNVLIIFITAFDDAEIRAQAMKEGAVEFLAKPFDHHLLLKTVRAALDMSASLAWHRQVESKLGSNPPHIGVRFPDGLRD
jgi:two-component system, LuxR family, response regulator FixJ